MCTDTPDGRKGEALAVDGRICVDVNECETAAGRVCSHKCSDTHSCHAKPDPYSAIFFSLGSEVLDSLVSLSHHNISTSNYSC
uniref:Uncharacterized protein n=1 Tax=Parascaris equorum TaxID=6256 RepID=A0A914S6K5_PAREQ